MKTSLMLSTIFTVLVTTGSNAWGQDTVNLEHDGQAGVWFSAPRAKEVLADVVSYRNTLVLMNDLEVLSDLRLERVENLKLALGHSEASETRAIQAMEIAAKERDDARAELQKWYRHPALWGTVGGVVAVGLIVGAVKIVQAME